MNLADDDRARVPFALVGVVVLVASATTAAVLAGHDPAPDRTRADRAVDRAVTGVDVALAGAARTAFGRAARNPVVSPGDTRFGRAIDPARAFRDALALRVYARFERELRALDARAGGVTANASLPRARTTADARRAIEATRIQRVNDSVARVTVSGVRVTVRRGGRVVHESRRNVSVRIHSPVLTLYDRVQRFERLLDRGAFAGPGLDRRLTDLLHRVVWLRGPLQYAGAPISNVLANRHVELAANRAVLDVQERALGRADAAGSAAYERAFARVGFTDVLAVARSAAKGRAAELLGDTGVPESAAHVGFPALVEAGTPPSQTVSFGVNVTADRAFVAFTGDGEHSLDDTLRAAFTTTASRVVETTRVDTTGEQYGTAPENWTLAGTTTTTDVTVTGRTAPGHVPLAGLREVESYGRRVVRETREERRYVNGSRERTVVDVERTTFRVSVGLGYEVAPPIRERVTPAADPVLNQPSDSVGPVVRERIAAGATRKLVRESGGVDAIVRRAVGGEVVDRTAVVRPRIPGEVRQRAYRAAARLRDRARTLSENVSMRELAAGDVPVDALADRLWGLHDVRTEYQSASTRAVAAVRETYLAHAVERVREREGTGALAGLGSELGNRGVEQPPRSRATGVDAGPVKAVEGSPAYLTLGEVTPSVDGDVDAPYHPLAARNVNWFTVPHGDAADAVLSKAMSEPPARVSVGRAAQALRAANRTLAERGNATLRQRRDALQTAVVDSVRDARAAYRGVLAASSVDFAAHERRAITRFALSRWPSVHARATAIANGSAARAVAAEAARVVELSPAQRDRLAARLRARSPTVADRGTVRVAPDLVRKTTGAARQVAMTVAKESLMRGSEVAVERAARRLGGANLGAVPAGLPLAPVPGAWYATFNAWSVSVEGSWARFAVHGSGSPVGAGNGTAYVRQDEVVSFDVNGDGHPEEVGRNERLSFEVETTVGVLVPSGPRGVGDVGGDRDERSPGW